MPETIDNALMTEGMSDAVRRDPQHIAGRSGYRALDTSTPIVEGTYAASRAAVDVALTAVDLVLGGDRAAYGLCRPPGHHASRSMYGGYCYFNNAAIAAEAIARATGEPVAILDVDYHHGNGTEQIFWRRGDVLYVSLHAHPDREYPYFLGWPEETGEGPGEGANLNIPLPAATTNEQYLAALDRGLERIADHGGSTLVVSLGFDTYGLDPLGDFALTTEVYHEVGRRAAATGRRLVILQEGGYYVPALGENARAWLRGAEGRPARTSPARHEVRERARRASRPPRHARSPPRPPPVTARRCPPRDRSRRPGGRRRTVPPPARSFDLALPVPARPPHLADNARRQQHLVGREPACRSRTQSGSRRT